jgi:hypothetical protein
MGSFPELTPRLSYSRHSEAPGPLTTHVAAVSSRRIVRHSAHHNRKYVIRAATAESPKKQEIRRATSHRRHAGSSATQAGVEKTSRYARTQPAVKLERASGCQLETRGRPSARHRAGACSYSNLTNRSRATVPKMIAAPPAISTVITAVMTRVSILLPNH